MANGAPDFRFRNQLNVAGIANVLASKPGREEQIKASRQQRQLGQLSFLLQSVNLGSQLANSAINRSMVKQTRVAQAGLANAIESLTSVQQMAPTPILQSPITQFQRLPLGMQGPPFISSGQVQPTLGQTTAGQNALSRATTAAARVSPKFAAQAIIKQQFGSETDQLDLLLKQAQVKKALFGDPVTEQDKINTALKLQKGFSSRKEIKDAIDVGSNVKGMDAFLSAAIRGDIKNRIALEQALVTMFNKVTDPGSVVRESEFARTPENAPTVNRVVGAIKKIQTGGVGLTNEDRKALVLGAKIIANERFQTAENTRLSFIELAKETKVNQRIAVGGVPKFNLFKLDFQRTTNRPPLTDFIEGD